MNFDIRENYHCFISQYKQRHVIIYNRIQEKSAITAINWRAEKVFQYFFFFIMFILHMVTYNIVALLQFSFLQFVIGKSYM